jgi:hypothetical protein
MNPSHLNTSVEIPLMFLRRFALMSEADHRCLRIKFQTFWEKPVYRIVYHEDLIGTFNESTEVLKLKRE